MCSKQGFFLTALGHGEEIKFVVVFALTFRLPDARINTSFALNSLLYSLELKLGDNGVKLLTDLVGSGRKVGDRIVADNLVAWLREREAPNGGPGLAVEVSVDLGDC